MAERADKNKNEPTPAHEAATPPAAAPGATALSIADIKELFVLMKANEIAELNLEQQGTKIHIVSTHAPQPAPSAAPVPQIMPVMHPGMMGVPGPAPAATTATADSAVVRTVPPSPEPPPPSEPPAPSNLKTIYSPMVGTFYRSPAPDAAPFVRVGDSVSEDTVLCIIEAMKLMNEIKAECKGRVNKILVENGVPVEYNQPLFLIEPE